MEELRVGFVGFGEVASVFSAALVEHGATVNAYDVLLDRQGGEDILRGRRRTEEVRFLPLPDLVKGSEYLLSTVTSAVAEDVARNCAPYLRPGHAYVDLNATAPAVKRTIQGLVQSTGADFVEGAILGAVGVTGSRTKILAGGPTGAEAATRLAQGGLNVTFYSLEVGKASTFKLLRSVFSKGLEALLLEFLVAGRRAGLQEGLWEEVLQLLHGQSFGDVAANWIRTHAVAHQRRYQEMIQVAELLREIGVDPVITNATERFFQRSCDLGFDREFSELPDSMEDVIAWMEHRL